MASSKGRVTYPPCVGDNHSYGPWRRASEADERAMAEANLDLLRVLVHGGHEVATVAQVAARAPGFDAHWWHPIQLAHIEQTGRFPLYDRACLACGVTQRSPQHPDHSDHPHKGVVAGIVTEGLDAWLSP